MDLVVVDARVSDLRPNPRNPRRIRPERMEQLKRTVAAEPELLRARPLIALPDGTVIAGNMRLQAVIGLGWETVPTVFADVDEMRAAVWMFLDNRGFGEDDEDLAGELLAELQARGVDLDLTGFERAETEALLRRLLQREKDPDAAPPLPEGKPDSQLGRIYHLGEHVLVCADSSDRDQLVALMDGRLADVLWTDPPYGVGIVGRTVRRLRISNDTAEGLPDLLAGVFGSVDQVLAPSARFYICAPAGPQGTTFRLAIEVTGWQFHESLVWLKDALVLGHSDYHLIHEDVLYGWKSGPGRPGRGRHRGSRWYGDNRQSSVLSVPRPKRSEQHPTMKPTGLIVPLLVNSSRPGDLVLDPFAGSGSTLIACEQSGRRCVAIEIDPRYCDVIRSRYEAFTNGC
jgi:DNA modification methylase